jgi:hypothetical protein
VQCVSGQSAIKECYDGKQHDIGISYGRFSNFGVRRPSG